MALPSLAPPPPVQRPRVLVIGTVFATAATLMAFAGVLGTYLMLRAETIAGGERWLPDGVVIPLTQPTVMFFGLVMSAVTMQWAVSAVKHDDRQNTYLALGVTLVFGAAFVNMTAYLYTRMELVVAETTQAVLIYTITGAHVVMALVAMVFVALMAFRALVGEFTSRHHDGLVSAAIFWHAMVAVYAIIWYAIYITK